MIRLSKKGSYALKAVLYISKSLDLVKIGDISKSQNISEGMVRRMIAHLEKSGILHTIRGRNGGVKLGKTLKEISLYDIFFSVGEELGISECTRGEYCERQEECSTTEIIGNLQKGLHALLKLYTLDKLIKNPE